MGTGTLGVVVDIVIWVVRIIIIGYAIPSIPKIVEGKANDDERTFNKAIVTLIIVVAVFVASFPLANVIKTSLDSAIQGAASSGGASISTTIL